MEVIRFDTWKKKESYDPHIVWSVVRIGFHIGIININ